MLEATNDVLHDRISRPLMSRRRRDEGPEMPSFIPVVATLPSVRVARHALVLSVLENARVALTSRRRRDVREDGANSSIDVRPC